MKATLLRSARLCADFSSGPKRCKEIKRGKSPSEDQLIAESTSPLWDLNAPHPERVLQAGKVQNLRVAANRLDGVIIPSASVFSFWKQIGFPSRLRGFVLGRELRQGCLIPSVGGGLCQLSCALYDCALQADFKILERHAHTQIVPGSRAEIGRDATVFWNYVDLRFSFPETFRFQVDLTSHQLVARLWKSKSKS